MQHLRWSTFPHVLHKQRGWHSPDWSELGWSCFPILWYICSTKKSLLHIALSTKYVSILAYRKRLYLTIYVSISYPINCTKCKQSVTIILPPKLQKTKFAHFSENDRLMDSAPSNQPRVSFYRKKVFINFPTTSPSVSLMTDGSSLSSGLLPPLT